MWSNWQPKRHSQQAGLKIGASGQQQRVSCVLPGKTRGCRAKLRSAASAFTWPLEQGGPFHLRRVGNTRRHADASDALRDDPPYGCIAAYPLALFAAIAPQIIAIG